MKSEIYVSPFDVCDLPVRVEISEAHGPCWTLIITMSGGWCQMNFPVASLQEAQMILDRWLPVGTDSRRHCALSFSDFSTQLQRWRSGRLGWATRRAAA